LYTGLGPAPWRPYWRGRGKLAGEVRASELFETRPSMSSESKRDACHDMVVGELDLGKTHSTLGPGTSRRKTGIQTEGEPPAHGIAITG